MTEAELQTRVLELARWHRWLAHHDRPARTRDGWRTPVQGDAGYPDLTLAGHGRLVLVELKSDRGRLDGAQETWRDALRRIAGIEYYVWRPKDWDVVQQVLVPGYRWDAEPAAETGG